MSESKISCANKMELLKLLWTRALLCWLWLKSWWLSDSVKLHDDYATVETWVGGEKKRIFLPRLRHIERHRAYLVRDGELLDITQPYRIPYLVSARMLGGEKIIIKHSSGAIDEYEENQVPKI